MLDDQLEVIKRSNIEGVKDVVLLFKEKKTMERERGYNSLVQLALVLQLRDSIQH